MKVFRFESMAYSSRLGYSVSKIVFNSAINNFSIENPTFFENNDFIYNFK